MQTLILDSSDLQRLVRQVGVNELLDELIDRLQQAFLSFDPRKTQTPQRTGFHYEDPTGLIEWMPLYQRGDKVLMKLVGYHPESPKQHGTPTIVSTISSYDTTTGHLLSIVEGTFATAIRTGAASAIASRLMAAPDSQVLGLVGCGAQAVTQLHAISRLFDLRDVLIYDVDEAAAESFSMRTTAFAKDLSIRRASRDEIAMESDIICTATSVEVGGGPVLSLAGAQPHVHVNAVGSDFPGKTELPKRFLERSFVSADFVPQAMVEGECQQLSAEQVGPSIIDIARAPQQFEFVKTQSSVFDSTGWALEDWVASELLLQYATELGIGRLVPIEYTPKDPLNPYDFVTDERLASFRERVPES